MQATAWPEDAVEVGRILGAFGVKGWIKVQPFSFDASALGATKTWWLSGDRPGQPSRQAFKVVALRDHGEGLVAQLEGVNDRDAADKLKGVLLAVPRSVFPKTQGEEYYWVDLIGLSVVNVNGEALGTVIDLIDTGPHSVFRIAPPGIDKPTPKQERLIPFVSAYVQSVDLAARQIRVDWSTDWEAED
ncbi:ribosome maturation factor RimM [Inhella gelatinilytica]|uniref:Ribosome maturation factor RimM n=1 Tax=Inhella gelatinilytica TaxID=2795030 RepID=A0A931NDP7_9BURK|nr:ribosome maturation factor RimM [Inhella gelatinilytica]MBH9552844.1 ribosome maturation factor RimM [Inhella gelatinilytica]